MTKRYTTNYTDTLILVAEDCKVAQGTVPTKAGTIAALQYELLRDAPYALTSDALLIAVEARRKDIPSDELDALADVFHSRGQACLRASPLAKTYGWGFHHDAEGKVALVDMSSPRYAALIEDEETAKTRAMRSSR